MLRRLLVLRDVHLALGVLGDDRHIVGNDQVGIVEVK
jgi:hypothetical protein